MKGIINQDKGKITNKILLFVFIFSQFFTIKLYGLLDIQIIILLAFFLLYSQERLPVLSVRYSISILVLTIFFLYSLIVYLISDFPEIFENQRIFRALVASLFLYLIFEIKRFNFYKVSNILIAIIIIHAIFMILEVLFVDFSQAMMSIMQIDIERSNFRALGLVRSYDASGMFLIIGIILSSAMHRLTSRPRYIAIILFLWSTGFLSGRTFMVIGTVFTLFFIWQYFIRSKLTFKKILFILLFAILGYLVWNFASSLLISTFLFTFYPESGDLKNIGSSNNGYYLGSFSIISYMLSDINNLTEHIFGGGGRLITSDIGYYKVLYSFGVLGLIFTLVYIYSTYLFIKNQITLLDKRFIIFPLLLLYFIYSFKMQIFFSRGFHEIYLIIILSLINWRKRVD